MHAAVGIGPIGEVAVSEFADNVPGKLVRQHRRDGLFLRVRAVGLTDGRIILEIVGPVIEITYLAVGFITEGVTGCDGAIPVVVSGVGDKQRKGGDMLIR